MQCPHRIMASDEEIASSMASILALAMAHVDGRSDDVTMLIAHEGGHPHSLIMAAAVIVKSAIEMATDEDAQATRGLLQRMAYNVARRP